MNDAMTHYSRSHVIYDAFAVMGSVFRMTHRAPNDAWMTQLLRKRHSQSTSNPRGLRPADDAMTYSFSLFLEIYKIGVIDMLFYIGREIRARGVIASLARGGAQ